MWKIMRYDRKTKTTRVEFEHSINFTSELLAALYCTQSTQHPCHECNSRMILFAKGKRRILDWQHGRRSFYMISFAVNPFYIYMVCLRWRAFLSARSSTRYFCLPTWHEDPLHDLLYGFGGVHDRIDIISSYHHRHHYASIKELACVMQHTSLILYRFRLSTSASSFSLLIAAYLH